MQIVRVQSLAFERKGGVEEISQGSLRRAAPVVKMLVLFLLRALNCVHFFLLIVEIDSSSTQRPLHIHQCFVELL